MSKDPANQRVTILMTHHEKTMLQKQAAFLNVSLSAYIRLKLNSYLKR